VFEPRRFDTGAPSHRFRAPEIVAPSESAGWYARTISYTRATHPSFAAICAALLATALASLPALRARAESSDAEPVRLGYEAPPECPAIDVFARGVFGRTPKARPAAGGEAAREFSARLELRQGGFTGRFTLRDPSGAESVRGPLRGKTCEEVVDAIAFSVAITIDPNAAAKPVPAPVPDASEPVPEPPSSAEPPAAPASPPPRPTTPAPPPSSPGAPKPTATVPANQRRAAHPLWMDAGAHASLETGLRGEPAPGAAAFFGIGSPDERTFAPYVRLWAAVDGQPDAPARPTGYAHFRWYLGRLDGCPVRFGRSRLNARACATVEGGLLFASGVDVADARSTRTAWVGLGAGLRLGWQFAALFALELEGDALAPLRRPPFQFGPRAGPPTDSVRAPAALPRASLGVAVRIP
jgi:hypothetical protein